jgi:hypothetical protein
VAAYFVDPIITPGKGGDSKMRRGREIIQNGERKHSLGID